MSPFLASVGRARAQIGGVPAYIGGVRGKMEVGKMEADLDAKVEEGRDRTVVIKRHALQCRTKLRGGEREELGGGRVEQNGRGGQRERKRGREERVREVGRRQRKRGREER
eukprot:2818918-Rhodomonas_salina.3